MVLFILAKMAVPHFQHKVMRSVVKVGRKDMSQKIELFATRRAQARLAELEAKNLKGWCEDPGNDTLVYVDSFVDPEKRHRLIISFEYSAVGHILACSCKDFEKERKVCQHIALLQLVCPPLSYLRQGLLRYHDKFQDTMLEPVQSECDQSSVTAKSDFISHVIRRLGQLDLVRDKSKTLPDMDGIVDGLRKLLVDFEAGVDVPRARQTQKF